MTISQKPAGSATGRASLSLPSMPWLRSAQALGFYAVTAMLLLLPFVVKLDGKPHADWQQFLGRFHPLAVHLPIGLLVLVPVLEVAGRHRPALREAAGFVLGLALLACLGALALGYLLAYGGGETGPGVTRHMWGGIALCVLVFLCLLVRSARVPWLYPAALTGVVLVLAWTAHQGGSLTHGSDYLTQYMPAPLKRVVMLGAAKALAPHSFYARQINPILDANCVSCHGTSKVSGGLRLDSYDQLMLGGKDGAVVRPGHADTSLLLERVTLPTGHKLFMPAEGRPPLKADEIALLRAWIQQGASPTDATVAGGTVRTRVEVPRVPVGDYSSLMLAIEQMAAGQGAKLEPVSSKPSDGLILQTADAPAAFGDQQLAQLAPYAPYIVEAELGRTAITDAAFDLLAKCTHLRALHLEQTAITGSGLQKLAGLKELTYLNLSGTKVTAAALAGLGSRRDALHIYLFNTPAEPAPVAAAADATHPDGKKAEGKTE